MVMDRFRSGMSCGKLNNYINSSLFWGVLCMNLEMGKVVFIPALVYFYIKPM